MQPLQPITQEEKNRATMAHNQFIEREIQKNGEVTLQMPVKSESKGFDSVVEDTPDGQRLTGVIDKTTGNVQPAVRPAFGGGQRAMEVARLQKLRATNPEEFERLKAAANAGR